MAVGGTAEVNDAGEVVFTRGSDVTALDYTFQVTAPADVKDGDTFKFDATAKAEEFPDDAECDTDDNIDVDSDYGMLYGEAAGETTMGLPVGGHGFAKAEAQTDVSNTAGTHREGESWTLVWNTPPHRRLTTWGSRGKRAQGAGD